MIQKLLFSAALICSSFLASAQWAVVDTTNQYNYMGVHFWDAQNGIVGADYGGIFRKTNNGGSSFTAVQAPFILPMRDMQFVDALHGFACGGSGFSFIQNVLVGTNDGGQTWDTLIANAPWSIEFSGVRFKNKDTGMLFGYASLHRSFDGGHSLVRIPRPDTNFYVQDVALLPDNSLLVAGSLTISSNVQKIYRSTNWGANWTSVYTSTTVGVLSLAMKDGLGIAACSRGRIMRTTDNGQNWTTAQIAQDTAYFTKVKFGAQGEVYLLAYIETDGYLYGSNDGLVWQNSLVAANDYLVDISMPTKQTGYIIGYNKVYRTTTGGGMTLSVKEASSEMNDIDVYPNPASDVINIRNRSGKEIVGVSLTDVTGKLVKKETGEVKAINTADLRKGIYLLEISTEENRTTRKIVIE